MQTTVEIDDQLLKQAMQGGSEDSASAVVADSLRLLIQMRAQQALRQLRGKVQWEGDLEASRQGRVRS